MNKHYKSICPCKDCVPPERHEACHDHCPKYLEWRSTYTGETKEQRVERELQDYGRMKTTDIAKYMRSRHYRRSRHKS